MPKDGNTSPVFNEEAKLPVKLRQRLMDMLKSHAPLFLTPELNEKIGDKIEAFKGICDIRKRAVSAKKTITQREKTKNDSDFLKSLFELDTLLIGCVTKELIHLIINSIGHAKIGIRMRYQLFVDI